MITLWEGETDQETFDFIVAKLREQGEPSFAKLGHSDDVTCVYGVEGQKRCAVGHLMGAKTFLGAAGLQNLINNNVVKKPRSSVLLARMQKDHDYPVFDGWRGLEWASKCASNMTATAIASGLDPKSSVEWYDYANSKLNEPHP